MLLADPGPDANTLLADLGQGAFTLWPDPVRALTPSGLTRSGR